MVCELYSKKAKFILTSLSPRIFSSTEMYEQEEHARLKAAYIANAGPEKFKLKLRQGKPKRPPTAYFHFLAHMRKTLRVSKDILKALDFYFIIILFTEDVSLTAFLSPCKLVETGRQTSGSEGDQQEGWREVETHGLRSESTL